MGFWAFSLLWIKEESVADEVLEKIIYKWGLRIKNESLRLRFLDKKRKFLFKELSLAVF